MNTKDVLRDIEAFGSLTFYVAVLARSLVGLDWTFFTQLLLALVIIYAAHYLFTFAHQKMSFHVAQGVVLFILVNNFYQSREFLIFSFVLLLLLCISHMKIRHHHLGEVLRGLLVGLVSGVLFVFLSANI